METGAITSYFDVAQLVLYIFWLFFAGLIYWLVRESHREGYPMVSETGAQIGGWPVPREPKVYKLMDGREVLVPDPNRSERVLAAEPAHSWTGAPLVPTGNPFDAGIGSGAWSDRRDEPDHDFEGANKIQPMRRTPDYGVWDGDTDPRGLTVYGADREPGGTVVDLWVDVSENLFRYLELETAGGRRVLLPINFSRIKRDAVHVGAILGSQFAAVPGTRDPDVVTMLEEEKIQAYYGAGLLYAEPSRTEPLV